MLPNDCGLRGIRSMRIIDLSMTINPENPDWIKTIPYIPKIDPKWKIPPEIHEAKFRIKPWLAFDGSLYEDIELFSHAGTHIEAPYHQPSIDSTKTIGEFAIETFVGPGVVIDFSFVGKEPDAKSKELIEHHGFAGKIVSDKDFEKVGKNIRKGDIVLTYTRFRGKYVSLIGEEAAEWLISKDAKMVGTNDESIIFTPGGHKALLENSIPIIECLVNLDKIDKERVLIVALPLRITGLSGVPARVIAIEDLELT